MTDSKTATERVEDVDTVYRERIMPRVELEDVPTREIREWSVLAHSVMELTGPAPFGKDGRVSLWLHEKSLTKLFDMCDAIDRKFAEIEKAATLGSGTLTAERVRDVIMSADRWEKPMGNTGLTNTHLIIRDDGWQAIADELNAALGYYNRISERLRGIAAEMRNIGASSMTPRELFAYWAGEVDKAADLADFMCGVNPVGLPVGLTISEDGDLLNWRGENYVKQATLGSGKLTAEQVRDAVEKHWHDLPDEYDMPEASALSEYSYDWHAIADELNATLGSGECEFELNTDMTAIRCDKCGYELPAGTNLNATRYCGGCGKAVKR